MRLSVLTMAKRVLDLDLDVKIFEINTYEVPNELDSNFDLENDGKGR